MHGKRDGYPKNPIGKKIRQDKSAVESFWHFSAKPDEREIPTHPEIHNRTKWRKYERGPYELANGRLGA
jgi:hypothetical protein